MRFENIIKTNYLTRYRVEYVKRSQWRVRNLFDNGEVYPVAEDCFRLGLGSFFQAGSSEGDARFERLKLGLLALNHAATEFALAPVSSRHVKSPLFVINALTKTTSLFPVFEFGSDYFYLIPSPTILRMIFCEFFDAEVMAVWSDEALAELLTFLLKAPSIENLLLEEPDKLSLKSHMEINPYPYQDNTKDAYSLSGKPNSNIYNPKIFQKPALSNHTQWHTHHPLYPLISDNSALKIAFSAKQLERINHKPWDVKLFREKLDDYIEKYYFKEDKLIRGKRKRSEEAVVVAADDSAPAEEGVVADRMPKEMVVDVARGTGVQVQAERESAGTRQVGAGAPVASRVAGKTPKTKLITAPVLTGDPKRRFRLFKPNDNVEHELAFYQLTKTFDWRLISDEETLLFQEQAPNFRKKLYGQLIKGNYPSCIDDNFVKAALFACEANVISVSEFASISLQWTAIKSRAYLSTGGQKVYKLYNNGMLNPDAAAIFKITLGRNFQGQNPEYQKKFSELLNDLRGVSATEATFVLYPMADDSEWSGMGRTLDYIGHIPFLSTIRLEKDGIKYGVVPSFTMVQKTNQIIYADEAEIAVACIGPVDEERIASDHSVILHVINISFPGCETPKMADGLDSEDVDFWKHDGFHLNTSSCVDKGHRLAFIRQYYLLKAKIKSARPIFRFPHERQLAQLADLLFSEYIYSKAPKSEGSSLFFANTPMGRFFLTLIDKIIGKEDFKSHTAADYKPNQSLRPLSVDLASLIVEEFEQHQDGYKEEFDIDFQASLGNGPGMDRVAETVRSAFTFHK